MFYGRRLFLRKLYGIKKEIDEILKNEELAEASVVEVPGLDGVSTFIIKLEDTSKEIDKSLHDLVKKVIKEEKPSKLAAVADAAESKSFWEKVKEFPGKVYDRLKGYLTWIKDKILEYGGAAKDRLLKLYDSLVDFSKTNPYIAMSIACFIVLILLAILYSGEKFEFGEIYKAFVTAIEKVWKSVKETWAEEGFTSKLYAVLKLVFSPILVVVQLFEEYEDSTQIVALGSLCMVFLLCGFVFYSVNASGAGIAQKSRLRRNYYDF